MFDLGGVLVQWDPDQLIAASFNDTDLRKRIRRDVIDHPDWLALDRGTLLKELAVARAAQRARVNVAVLTRFFAAIPAALAPIPDAIRLLRLLHARGYRLYCLSNMHVASIEHLEKTHDFFALFSGRTISCRLHSIKPEPAIYQALLTAYALRPQETVFIDDLQVNLDTARSLGLHTIRFESAAQCQAALAQLGCS